MALLASHEYCEICRSGSKDDDPCEVRCKLCGGGFHLFCYSQSYPPERLSLPEGEFTCHPCHEKHGDNFCHLCEKNFELEKKMRLHFGQDPVVDEHDKCPGCCKQAHVRCSKGLEVDVTVGKLVGGLFSK